METEKFPSKITKKLAIPFIYLDNNSTTPLDSRVLEAMMPYLTDQYANPSSTHKLGTSVGKAVTIARQHVAELLNADEHEIIFTSGATESINIGIIGFALKNSHKGRHIITIESEHKAVLDCTKYLESVGFQITYLPVDKNGRINLDELDRSIRLDTILVSTMVANNETGTIHPISAIAEIAHQKNSVLFCDATQAIGKVNIDVAQLGADMMALSAHKFYGPKGIGALYVSDLKKNRRKLQAIQHGGGQEQGLRSGTTNTPAVVGLGKACELSRAEISEDIRRLAPLRDLLEKQMLTIPESFVNGDVHNRLYNTANLCFPGLDAVNFVSKIETIALSNGSACTAAVVEPSHVLKAMGLSDEQANASIRFSLGRFNTEDQINDAISRLKETIVKDMHYAKVD